MTLIVYKKGSQRVVKLGIKTVLKISYKSYQKGSQKILEKVMEIGLQSKYSGPLPTFVDCQKDSQTTVGKGTQVKPVLLAVKIFAVYAPVQLRVIVPLKKWRGPH